VLVAGNACCVNTRHRVGDEGASDVRKLRQLSAGDAGTVDEVSGYTIYNDRLR
jgi:hypothetical protein